MSVMEKVPMTLQGHQRLEEELKQRKTIERPDIIKAIAEAREYGDLSENAEYHAARERQSFSEGRIAALEDILSRAEVIDVASLTGDSIKFGAHVKMIDEDTQEKMTYQIVSPIEADIHQSRISTTSPIGKALIGKVIGDLVEVTVPGGTKTYEILDVYFI